MENLIKNLEKHLKSLNVEQLYKEPGHKKSKDWIAEVGSALKISGRHSYKDFKNLSQHLYPSIPLETRKHAAEQIDVLLRQVIIQYKSEDSVSPSPLKNVNNPNQETEPYVNKNILEGFRLKEGAFNYQKLITLIEELNFNVENKKTYSSCMILRAILDHVPPLLEKKDFKDVVNSYNWGSERSSPRKAVKLLLDFKNIPDDVLHGQITNKSDVIDFSYLPHKYLVNILLQQCLASEAKFSVTNKSVQPDVVKSESVKSDLMIEFYEQKVSWANYAVSRWVWPSFRMVLSINNFHNKSAEYLRAYLNAKSNDGVWEAKNFVFLNRENEDKSEPNQDFRVEAGYKEKVSLFISIYEIGEHNQKPMPDVDKDTLKLVIETESGKTLALPIKAGWIGNG